MAVHRVGNVMISKEARAEIDRMLAARDEASRNPAPPRTLEEERADWEASGLQSPLPEGARYEAVNAGGVLAEWMEMPGVRPDQALLLVHGGGYTSGSPITHRKLAANLSRAANSRALTPHYRLAPEHPFPAGVNDAIMAYDWLRTQGIAARDIIVVGDSAGAGLALSMLVALPDTGAPMPAAAVLMSAWTDLTVSSPSMDTHRDVDVQVTRDSLLAAARLYMGEGDPADPRASTLFADPTGLPPLLFQVGGAEVLLDDSRIFVERARAAGVDATLQVFDGMWHVFQSHAPGVPEAEAAINKIAAFIRAHLSD